MENGVNGVMAVGMYPLGASPVGCLDLSGNLWEWCKNNYHDKADADRAYQGPRAVRGGAWDLPKEDACMTSRQWYPPSARTNVIGFRVVLKLGHSVA